MDADRHDFQKWWDEFFEENKLDEKARDMANGDESSQGAILRQQRRIAQCAWFGCKEVLQDDYEKDGSKDIS